MASFFFFLQRAGLSAHVVTIHNSPDIEANKCPSTEEQIKKMWYIYIQWNTTQPKKNEIMPFVATWMDLEIIIRSEIRQRQKPYDITYMWNLSKFEA